jgi:hypothetical protein
MKCIQNFGNEASWKAATCKTRWEDKVKAAVREIFCEDVGISSVESLDCAGCR